MGALYILVLKTTAKSYVYKTLRKISDVITDMIEPNPQGEVKTEVKIINDKTLIIININKGIKHLYCQKKYGFSPNGCSIRIGTTCKNMTADQIKIRYEQKFINNEYMLKKKSNMKDLTFRELKIYYIEKGYHLDEKTFETNLNLKREDGEYNLLAELLSDKNNIPFIVVKFKGENKASISERNDYGYGCLLSTYIKIKNRLEAENICFTDTTVRPRKDEYLFDFDSVNEAVLNAFVHNDWTITEPQISIFNNRIEILSHGGIPEGMSEKDFFEGISKPRNATLMRIFLNMGLTEHTGHGIPTIVNKYGKSVFKITNNYIHCIIPFNEKVRKEIKNKLFAQNSSKIKLTRTQEKMLKYLLIDPSMIANELSKKIGVSRRTIERSLKDLENKKIIERIGSKKDGNWIVVK